jgi:hypothetical protein
MGVAVPGSLGGSGGTSISSSSSSSSIHGTNGNDFPEQADDVVVLQTTSHPLCCCCSSSSTTTTTATATKQQRRRRRRRRPRRVAAVVTLPLSRNYYLVLYYTLFTATTATLLCGVVRGREYSAPTVPQNPHRPSYHHRSKTIPSQRLPSIGDYRNEANAFQNNDFYATYNNLDENEQDGVLTDDFAEPWYPPRQPPLSQQPLSFEPNYYDPQSRHDNSATTATAAASDTRQPPPPPPPPQHPIHYAFPVSNQSPTPPLNESDDATNMATTTTRTTTGSTGSISEIPRFASARRDVVTAFITAKFTNRILLLVSAMAWGYGLSLFVSRSLLGSSAASSASTANLVVAVGFGLASTLRNNVYGEWIRALAMLLILSLQKWHDICRMYPTRRILWNQAPFPPRTMNPWTWENSPNQPCEFFMVYSVVAMAIVGAIVGANVPIILVPSSLLALIGAIGAAYVTTLPHSSTFSYGSVARCMGMRVVALARTSVYMERELHLGRHSAAVAGKLLDTVLILDRKHRLKDKLVAVTSWIIHATARIQQDASRRNSPSPTAGAVLTNDREASSSSRYYDDPTVAPPDRRPRSSRQAQPGASPLRRQPQFPNRPDEDGHHHFSTNRRRDFELSRDDHSRMEAREYTDGHEYDNDSEPWSGRDERLQPGPKRPPPESSKAKTGPSKKRWFS